VLATYSFDHFAAETPFCNPEPTWRLYEALAAEARIERPVTVAAPGWPRRDAARGWQAFRLAGQPLPEPLTVAPQAQGRLADLDGAPLTEVDLEPYGVVVLERSS